MASSEKMTLAQLVDILSILWKLFMGKEVEWDSVSRETAQSIVKGDHTWFANQFIAFLANGARFVFGGLKVTTVPFDPATFLGEGWTVWKGSADGDGFTDHEDRDVREDIISSIDWEEVIMDTHLQGNEISITGEEKLKRAKESRDIQLGGRSFLSLWKDYKTNGENSVLEKLRLKGVRRIYFFGLRLRNPDGNRVVLSLAFDESSLSLDEPSWDWGSHWLGGQFASPSASLSSVK